MVSALNQVFSDTGVVVVAHYSGLNVAQMTTLRGRMKDAGASLKVAKNRPSFESADVEHISDLFQGATVIVFQTQSYSKIAAEFAKDERQVRPAQRRHGRTSLTPRGARRAQIAR